MNNNTYKSIKYSEENGISSLYFVIRRNIYNKKMREIKKGDTVTRNSYNNDIIFKVDKIIRTSNNVRIAILKGIDIRIEADAPLV